MRICLDVRSPGAKGVLSVVNCLLKSLAKVDQANSYFLITDRKHAGWGYDGMRELVVPSLNPVAWIYWSNTILPKFVEQNKIDVYHSLKHVTAFHLKAKKVLTFHGGPTLYRFPQFYNWHDLMYWKISYSMAIRRYDRIITTAAAEKQYFIQNLGFPENKFTVTNLAADDRFRPIQDKTALMKVKDKLRLPDNFILYVGQIHPRKNLEGIIEAFHKARAQLPLKYTLVIVGGKGGAYFNKILSLVQTLGISDYVVFLDHVSDDDLPYIYNLANLFLFPSHYESFGIVFLEAMACGLPVIAPSIPDIDEIVGDAAVRVNPVYSSAIAAAIVQVLTSDQLKTLLRKRSLERANLFSWDRCASETIGIYEELVHG